MNLYELPDPLPNEEQFDDLIADRGIKIERIISSGQVTPPGEWYNQTRDEWATLLQGCATLEYADGRFENLQAGDHVLIPARVKHRVARTSSDPPCIWLAVHGSMS